MFDLDFSKLIVVGIVALAVIPPKDLPRVMRTVGQAVGKMRRMAAEFQNQFMDAMREADLESVRKELDALNEKAKVEAELDSVRRELDALNEKARLEVAAVSAAIRSDPATAAQSAATPPIALEKPEAPPIEPAAPAHPVEAAAAEPPAPAEAAAAKPSAAA